MSGLAIDRRGIVGWKRITYIYAVCERESVKVGVDVGACRHGAFGTKGLPLCSEIGALRALFRAIKGSTEQYRSHYYCVFNAVLCSYLKL
jgi:hypothetical protein